MNTDNATALMRAFLERSPRTAVEVQVVLNDARWRHGRAESVPSPVFEIGSVGKTFTTTLLALLMAQGKVSLSDTVAQYYPDLPWGGNPRYWNSTSVWQMSYSARSHNR